MTTDTVETEQRALGSGQWAVGSGQLNGEGSSRCERRRWLVLLWSRLVCTANSRPARQHTMYDSCSLYHIDRSYVCWWCGGTLPL